MINFSRSTFTWHSHPWQPDTHYKWAGGFVGKFGETYHVRFILDSKCKLRNSTGEKLAELFLGAPCRNEYTIASNNLFQIPSGEWRMAFSQNSIPSIANQHSAEPEKTRVKPLSQSYQNHKIDIRDYTKATYLSDVRSIIESTLDGDAQNALTIYEDEKTGIEVELEYPINVMNINVKEKEFQVCTGPILLPDLSTWDSQDIHRVFVAHAAFSRFDQVEFILRRSVDAATEERKWLDQPRGRDRFELINSQYQPSDFPPPRPKLYAYNETWELPAQNLVISTK